MRGWWLSCGIAYRTLPSWQKILLHSAILRCKLILIKGKMHISESHMETFPLSQMDTFSLSNVLLFEENSRADV